MRIFSLNEDLEVERRKLKNSMKKVELRRKEIYEKDEEMQMNEYAIQNLKYQLKTVNQEL